MKRLTFIKGLAMSGIGITLQNYLQWPNLTQRDLRVFPFPSPSQHVRHGSLSPLNTETQSTHFAQIVARDLLLGNGFSAGENDIEVIHFQIDGRPLSLTVLGSECKITNENKRLFTGQLGQLREGKEIAQNTKLLFFDSYKQIPPPACERFMFAVLDGEYLLNGKRVGKSEACWGKNLKPLSIHGEGRVVCIYQEG